MAKRESRSGLPRRPFARVIGRSATSLTNLGVFGVAAAAAAALASWPILAVGGAAYCALMAWDLANPSFWKKALGDGEGPEAPAFPDPNSLHHPPLAAAVRAILEARREMASVLAHTPADVRTNLAAAIGQVAELERHAASLIARGEDLSRYLATVDMDAVRTQVAELDARIRNTHDREARSQYTTARGARAEQLQAITDISDARERIVAKLATVVATLEGLAPKVVRMRALDAQAMDELTGSVNEELERMNGEIRVFEETLKSLGEVQHA